MLVVRNLLAFFKKKTAYKAILILTHCNKFPLFSLVSFAMLYAGVLWVGYLGFTERFFLCAYFMPPYILIIARFASRLLPRASKL
jgi:hypothetical protein